MDILDFIIGLTLVNAIPHFVIGIWKGRLLSGFGFSPRANLTYSALNFTVSISLVLYKYGISGLLENWMYLGGLFVVVSYFLVGKLCYTYFHQKHFEKRGKEDPIQNPGRIAGV